MRISARTGLTCLALTMALASAVAWAGPDGGCGACGQHSCFCPKPMKWYSEGGPRIRFRHACPRPTCDPCTLEHFGYYATCWSPWPYPPDWSHCPTPHSSAMLPPPPYPPYTPKRPAVPMQVPTPATNEPSRDLPAPTPSKTPTVRLLP